MLYLRLFCGKLTAGGTEWRKQYVFTFSRRFIDHFVRSSDRGYFFGGICCCSGYG